MKKGRIVKLGKYYNIRYVVYQLLFIHGIRPPIFNIFNLDCFETFFFYQFFLNILQNRTYLRQTLINIKCNFLFFFKNFGNPQDGNKKSAKF